MDGAAMVSLAQKWPGIGPRLTCKSKEVSPNVTVKPGHKVTSNVTTPSCAGTGDEIQYLEHVQAVVTLKYAPRGDLHLNLVSPSGTRCGHCLYTTFIFFTP